MSDTKNITGRMRAAFVTTPVGDDRWQAVLDVLHANGYRRCAEGQRTTQWCDRAEKAEAEVERLPCGHPAGCEKTVSGTQADGSEGSVEWCEWCAEIERLRADAERYRWLRSAEDKDIPYNKGKAGKARSLLGFQALDAAIDAARGES